MRVAEKLIRAMTAQVPAQVEVWWDPGQRVWTTQLKDVEGNQIGNADHDARKKTAVTAARRLAREQGVEVVVRTRKEG
jgi:hypothetical protein